MQKGPAALRVVAHRRDGCFIRLNERTGDQTACAISAWASYFVTLGAKNINCGVIGNFLWTCAQGDGHLLVTRHGGIHDLRQLLKWDLSRSNAGQNAD